MLHLIIHLLTNIHNTDITTLLLVQLGCLAIWKPKGIAIAKKYLSNGFENNNEGAGFAVAKKGKIEISKGFFTFDEFWKAFNPMQSLPAIIHFRIATHGKIEENNCHPFSMLDGKYAMAHNGVLPITPPKGRAESDSAYFAHNLLSPAVNKIPWKSDWFTELVEHAINRFNKVLVLREDGNIWIFNEKEGMWNKGAWFSNDSYKKSWAAYSDAYSGASCQSSFMFRHAAGEKDYWKSLGYDDDPVDRDMTSEDESRVYNWLEKVKDKAKKVIRKDHADEMVSVSFNGKVIYVPRREAWRYKNFNGTDYTLDHVPVC